MLLILDPDTDFVDILKGRVELMGWSTKRVKSLELAKQELKKKRIDVFFMDPHLEIHPEEILSEFVKNPEYQNPKLIVHTKIGTRKDIQTLKQIGVHVYWIKGHLSLSDLLRHIKKIL